MAKKRKSKNAVRPIEGEPDLYNARYKRGATISDNGPGMTPEQMKAALDGSMSSEEFERLSPAMAAMRTALGGATKKDAGGKPKRKPLLIDEIVNSKMLLSKIIDKDRYEKRMARLREAKVFVLDEEATVYAAEMIKNYPLMIARDQDFAIPGFKNMYVEFPYKPFFTTLNHSPYDDATGDDTVGYHIDGPDVYVMSRGNFRNQEYSGWGPSIAPFVYKLNRPTTVAEEKRFAPTFDRSGFPADSTIQTAFDTLFWGSSFVYVWDRPEAHSLRARHSFDVWYRKSIDEFTDGMDAKLLKYMITSAAGDLRNILALLLFINRTRDIRYDIDIPHARQMIHAKPSVLTKHSIIRLKLDPKPMLKKVAEARVGAGSSWRREHDVIGHFCHDRTTRQSNHAGDGDWRKGHDWREYGVNKWRCMLCSGQRWWRRECKRGKKDKGEVKSSYEVVK